VWQIHYMAVCFLFRKRRSVRCPLIFGFAHHPHMCRAMTAEDVRGRRGSARSMASGSALGAARSPAPAARPRAIYFFEFVHNGDCASSLVATLRHCPPGAQVKYKAYARRGGSVRARAAKSRAKNKAGPAPPHRAAAAG